MSASRNGVWASRCALVGPHHVGALYHGVQMQDGLAPEAIGLYMLVLSQLNVFKAPKL